MSWTEENVATLRKLWTEGLSAEKIANQLVGISRSAVCGKARRLGLEERGHVVGKQNKKKGSQAKNGTVAKTSRTPRKQKLIDSSPALAKAPSTNVVSLSKAKRFSAEEVVIPTSNQLLLMQLTEGTCKWPNGDPLREDFSFCGNAADGPYCIYHSRIAFQPRENRKAMR